MFAIIGRQSISSCAYLFSYDVLESDYHIPLRNICKEVENAYKLSQGVYDDGFVKGMSEGLTKGAINIAAL